MKYTVKTTAQFLRDYRRAEQQGRDMAALDRVIDALAEGETLPPENRDRPLAGKRAGCRECRITPGWMLIYRIDGDILVLTLTRAGTRAELYRKGGTAMRKSVSLRMLLRSPVKTAVTLLLIAAASFLFLYNLLDYAMTRREYDRNYGNYHGVFSLMHRQDELLDEQNKYMMTQRNIVFLSDPQGNPAYTEKYPKDSYHPADLTPEEVEKIAALPYVSQAQGRYMTAGVASFPRYYSINTLAENKYFLYTSRVVFEATFEKATPDIRRLDLPTLGSRLEQALKLTDVKVLAGNEEYLRQSRAYINKKLLYAELVANQADQWDGSLQFSYHGFAPVSGYAGNWISLEQILALEPGKRYVFVASVDPYHHGGSGILDEGKEGELFNIYTHIGDDSLYGTCDYFTPLEGEPENYLETEKFAGVRKMMEIIERDRYTLDVHYMEDVSSLRRYQEGALQLARGRNLTAEDSENHDPVCMISEELAQAYGLDLGDTLPLELGDKLLPQFYSMGAVAYSPQRYAENWTEQTFTIVGIFTDGGLKRLKAGSLSWTYGENAVFVPLSFLPETADTAGHAFQPSEVSFVIGDADSIIPFRDEVLPQLLEEGYMVYFFDGNWPSVKEQMGQAGSLSLVKLTAFAVSAVLVMLLTVYLYILRKKKEYAVMRALGCPADRARGALLFPLLVLALPAVAAGSVGAVVYTRRAAEVNAAEFSALGLTVDSSIPLGTLALGFCGSLALLLILALLALVRVAKKPPLELLQGDANPAARRKSALPPEPGEPVVYGALPELPEPVYRPHTALRHTVSYVAKHLRRTPVKSLLAVLLALVLAFSIGFFTLLRSTYRELYQNIEVHPRFLNGFTDNRAAEVAKSGYVKDPYYEYTRRDCESNFVEDTLVLTNDICRVTDAEILWREDKGPELFEEKRNFCVVSRDLADQLGYDLGSRAEICSSGYIYVLWQAHPELRDEELIEYYHQYTHHFTVAGIAEEEGMKFYAPLAARESFGSMFSDYVPLDLAEFTLVDYHKATEFRSYVFRVLVGRPGSFSMETGEADRVYQTYRLLELLYPIAFALALILGAVLPAGIILQSAKEASLLRVLGTTKRRTRAMLTLEQVVLCLLGLVCAAIGLIGLKGDALLPVSDLLSLYSGTHFLLCILGAALAAVSVTRRNVLELLQVKE